MNDQEQYANNWYRTVCGTQHAQERQCLDQANKLSYSGLIEKDLRKHYQKGLTIKGQRGHNADDP